MITTGEIYAHHRKQTKLYKSEIRRLRGECESMQERSEFGAINNKTSGRVTDNAVEQVKREMQERFAAELARRDEELKRKVEEKRINAAKHLIMLVFLFAAAMVILWGAQYLELIDRTIIRFLLTVLCWVVCFAAGWHYSAYKK